MKDIQNWTGERLETFVCTETTYEHLHRYALALELVSGKTVLDIACGEGYGTNLLAKNAENVVGVDIDAKTVTDAAQKYQLNNLSFKEGSAAKIPCENDTFDVVVSFETIEHHHQHDEMMLEIKRVLKPTGILIISSPDKLYYSDKPKYTNPFHVKELYENEFKTLINENFNYAKFLRQKPFVGSVIVPSSDSEPNDKINLYQGDFEKIETSDLGAPYLIAIASQQKLPVANASFFDGEKIFRKILIDQVTFNVSKKVAEEVSQAFKNSISYRLGNVIVKPMKALKKYSMSKLSVIIPNYNHEKYLSQRIESILSQTFQDFELIILDDFSKDDSKSVLEKYRNHPKVTQIAYNRENSGSPFKQWEKGLLLATSEWIWIAESDDYSEPTFLDVLLKLTEQKENIGIAVSNSHWVDGEGNIGQELSMYHHSFFKQGIDEVKHMMIHCTIQNVSSCIFKKDLAIQAIQGLGKYRACGDWIFYVRLLQQTDMAYTKNKLNYFRWYHNSVSTGAREILWITEGVDVLKNVNYNLVNYNQREFFRLMYFWARKTWNLNLSDKFSTLSTILTAIKKFYS